VSVASASGMSGGGIQHKRRRALCQVPFQGQAELSDILFAWCYGSAPVKGEFSNTYDWALAPTSRQGINNKFPYEIYNVLSMIAILKKKNQIL